MAEKNDINFNPISAIYSSDGFSTISDNRKEIKYDDILDDSLFRPDKEQVRQYALTGSGSNQQGVYDDKPDEVSDIEVKLRSGKLDKAEVTQLQHSERQKLDNINNEKNKQAELDKVEKIAKARQEHLDKATGFKGIDQSQTV